MAHRAIFRSERRRGFKIPDCTKWWGPDRHILPYFMTSKRDEIYVIGVVPAPRWDNDAASMPSSRVMPLIADFANFHDDLKKVLQQWLTMSASGSIYDRERDDRWSGDRIALLGDACHPMRPYMAAGGAMAIEDGAILSRCLTEFDDPSGSLRQMLHRHLEFRASLTCSEFPIENSWMRGPDRHRLVL